MTSFGRGTTSACAENTYPARSWAGHYRNYLRVRGEYWRNASDPGTLAELPPRARRIPYELPSGFSAPWNYLRVRGEYIVDDNLGNSKKELPPRARRIRPASHWRGLTRGTTSACAENTRRCRRLYPKAGNYLRVRGEYDRPPLAAPAAAELPPRARRIHLRGPQEVALIGTTSACAENTRLHKDTIRDLRNYLRVRGEYRVWPVRGCSHSELPPRARRIHTHLEYHLHKPGTTSACAENTYPHHHHHYRCWNYLRVRGEYHLYAVYPAPGPGTTSACAENTALVCVVYAPAGNYLRVRGEYGADAVDDEFS